MNKEIDIETRQLELLILRLEKLEKAIDKHFDDLIAALGK